MTSGSGQTGNTQIRKVAYFPVWPLPKVENWFQEQIWEGPYFYSKFFSLKSFGQYLKKSIEINFKLYFKKWFDQRMVHVLAEQISEKAPFYHPSLLDVFLCTLYCCMGLGSYRFGIHFFSDSFLWIYSLQLLDPIGSQYIRSI